MKVKCNKALKALSTIFATFCKHLIKSFIHSKFFFPNKICQIHLGAKHSPFIFMEPCWAKAMEGVNKFIHNPVTTPGVSDIWRLFFFFGLLRPAPGAYGSSQARDQIRATLPAYATATATPDPSPTKWGQESNPYPHGYWPGLLTSEPWWEPSLEMFPTMLLL